MAIDIIVSAKLSVEDQSQVGEARRKCVSLCKETGFDPVDTEKVAIIVTELGTNLIKYAKGDRFIIFQILEDTEFFIKFIEILSLDKGEGIENINTALNDGFSSGGTTGIGLGAIKRLSTQFDIFSMPGKGVAIYCKILPEKISRLPSTKSGDNSFKSNFEIGEIITPVINEIPCGDATCIREIDNRLLVMVADGLGHGTEAATAARAAKETFLQNLSHNPQKIVEKIHNALRSTRGVTVGIAEIIPDKSTLLFTGIGNIAGRVINANFTQNLVSHNGIAGGEYRKIQEFIYSWAPQSILVMHSDGISSRWDLREYPGIMAKSSQLIGSVIYRDFHRPKDDASIVVIKQKAESL